MLMLGAVPTSTVEAVGGGVNNRAAEVLLAMALWAYMLYYICRGGGRKAGIFVWAETSPVGDDNIISQVNCHVGRPL